MENKQVVNQIQDLKNELDELKKSQLIETKRELLTFCKGLINGIPGGFQDVDKVLLSGEMEIYGLRIFVNIYTPQSKNDEDSGNTFNEGEDLINQIYKD